MTIRVHVRANRPVSAVFSKASLVALALMAAGVSAFGQISSGSAYTVVNRVSGQAINETGGSGTQQQQYACNGSSAQNWTFTSVSSGYYTISSTVTGLYLDTNSSNQIIQKAKSGAATQNWQPYYIGNGFYTLLNQSSGDAMEVSNGSLSNNAVLDQNTNNGNPWQQWYITPWDTCRTGQYSGSSEGWVAVPIPGAASGYTMNLLALFGTMTMNNPNNSFDETLFGLGFIPSTWTPGCANGTGNINQVPSSWDYIVKSQTAQTLSVPISYWKSGGLGIPAASNSLNCLWMGFNAGTTSTINLAAIVGAEPTNSVQNVGFNLEACFIAPGCTDAHDLHPETVSYEGIYQVSTAGTLNYIWGDVSDATLNAPSGTWVATTDLYVFHGSSECSDVNGQIWNWDLNALPGDANLLMDIEESGVGRSVGQQTVFQTVNFPLKAGDCLVSLQSVPSDPGNAQVDMEEQFYVVITPN
jgi:hypothetical protein